MNELSKNRGLPPLKFLIRSAVVLMILCFSSSSIYAQRGEALSKLKNYVHAKDGLHTCGSIKSADLKAIHHQGVKTIISLNTESPSKVILLKGQAEALQMKYIHIPVSWEKPSLASLERFFNAMEESDKVETLVHCRLNWRASAFVYLYRTLRLNEAPDVAQKSLLEVWKPERNPVWKAFMQEAEKYFRTK